MTVPNREAGSIRDGWVYVPHPAALPGWYLVLDVTQDGGWTRMRVAGRYSEYVVASHTEVGWRKAAPGA